MTGKSAYPRKSKQKKFSYYLIEGEKHWRRRREGIYLIYSKLFPTFWRGKERSFKFLLSCFDYFLFILSLTARFSSNMAAAWESESGDKNIQCSSWWLSSLKLSHLILIQLKELTLLLSAEATFFCSLTQ